MTLKHARENLDYWQACYAEDEAAGRPSTAFGMMWMARQIELWEADVERLEAESR